MTWEMPSSLTLKETVAKVTSPKGEGTARVSEQPVYVFRLFSFRVWVPKSGRIAPEQAADYSVFRRLGVFHLPVSCRGHSPALGESQVACKSLTSRLQLTTMQVSSAWIVTLARPQ